MMKETQYNESNMAFVSKNINFEPIGWLEKVSEEYPNHIKKGR